MTHKMVHLIPKHKLSLVMHSQIILFITEYLNIIIYIEIIYFKLLYYITIRSVSQMGLSLSKE